MLLFLYRSRIIVPVTAIFLWGASVAHAQTDTPRMGAGLQYSALTLDYPGQTRSGVGGWFTYDVTRWLALDTNLSFYPTDDEIIGRQWQGLIGAKVGWRNERFGLFAKLRPGWFQFSQRFIRPETVCTLSAPQQIPTPEGCLVEHTNFALDIGGGMDVYPTRSTVLRVDAGNRMLRFTRTELPPVWTHNFQIDVAVGWRF